MLFTTNRGMNGKTAALTAVFMAMTASVALAGPDTHTLACGGHKTIQDAIRTLQPGDTLFVRGTCAENVVIGEEVHGITLDGQGAATIAGAPATASVTITGTGITIRGFTISGGAQGIAIQDGASAVIDRNTIEGAVMNGITVYRNSTAHITSNLIQHNLSNGINMQQNASARIGFTGGPSNRVRLPNTIQDNGGQGVQVTNGSSAQIFSGAIQHNGGHGVVVDRNSHVHITANVITGNVGDGVRATRNSGVDFGTDATGATRTFDDDTNTGLNGGYGVRCTIAGFVDGKLGALSGTLGGTYFFEGCAISIEP